VSACRWDLDKTYLRSEFDSFRQLLRTAFERPEDKDEVPGVAELIKVLKAAAERHQRRTLVYFISASPPQIGKAIRAKLALDGVPYDGIVFKNQLQHLRPGKLHNLREHVGFKLVELLRGRIGLPPETRELLFGDDWESDSLTYSLYADVLGGRVRPAELVPLLRRIRVDPLLVDEALSLLARVTTRDAVERIFINLERHTPPATFRLFGPRVVPTFNYFQTAAVLAADGHLDVEDVARVGEVLRDRAGYTGRRLENSLDDLARRGHVSDAAMEPLARALRGGGLFPATTAPSLRARAQRLLARLRPVRARPRPAVGPAPQPPDYAAVLDHLRSAPRGTAAAPSPRARGEEGP
jgi:hypothetical protein